MFFFAENFLPRPKFLGHIHSMVWTVNGIAKVQYFGSELQFFRQVSDDKMLQANVSKFTTIGKGKQFT